MSDDHRSGGRRARRQTVLATTAACLSAAIAAPLVIGSGGHGATGGSPTTSTTSHATAARAAECPHATRPLPADGVAAAGEAALKQARKLYGTAKDYRGLRIVQATWAPREPTRGRYARVKCGSTISKRTVVVALEFPREQGASLKEGVVLVSSTASGYEAWTVLH